MNDKEKETAILEHRALSSLVEAALVIRPDCTLPIGEKDRVGECNTCAFCLGDGWECGKARLRHWREELARKTAAMEGGGR